MVYHANTYEGADRTESYVSKSTQITYFQRARCLGALAVVLLHVLSTPMSDTPVEVLGFSRFFVWYEAQMVLTRWAVPVFFMITGVLLLNPEKRITWDKAFRYAGRMLLVLATFGLGMNFVKAYSAHGGLTLQTLLDAVQYTFSNTGFRHLWYLYVLIGFYLLLPLYRAFVSQASRRDLQILILLVFVLDLGVNTVNTLCGVHIEFLIIVSSSLFYFFLGYYAHHYLTLDGKVLATGILGLAIGTGLTAWYVFAEARYEMWVFSPDYVIIGPWSLVVFLLMKKYLNGPLEPHGIVSRFAELSFGIYVLHPLMIQVLYHMCGWGPIALPPLVYVFGVWSVTVVGSAALTWALRLIPPVRRIL